MTVCIAAIFQWRNTDLTFTPAILTASDRMWTVGVSEYDSEHKKVRGLRDRIVVLTSGDLTVHSEAEIKTRAELKEAPTDSVSEVAEIYAKYVREHRQRVIEQTYLSPLGMTAESFRAAQHAMAPHAVSDLISQMQNHHLRFDGIIAGCEDGSAHIYYIDSSGIVSSHSSPGFACAGIGAEHAFSELMSVNYESWWPYGRSILAVYAAKKKAETAPGVGHTTDLRIVNLSGGIADLDERSKSKIDDMHKARATRHKAGLDEDELEFIRFITAPPQGDKPASSSSDQT